MAKDTPAWRALSPYLPPRNLDYDYWWRLTGRYLAVLVDAAGYLVEKQYEALLFHYHWVVPYLGPAPRSNGTSGKWKSLLGPDGVPIEYSWKWNTSTGGPEIRYDLEAIGPLAGTELDPLNQQAPRELLHRLAAAIPSVDLSWGNHFLATLYDHDNSKYAQEAAAGAPLTTSVVIAVELSPKGIGFKTYFQPRKLGLPGVLPLPHWEASISQLDPENTARSALHNFLENDPEGKLMNPFSVSVDNVTPAKSRLKWYFNTPHSSFASVRQIMTLGGRIAHPHLAVQLEDLRELITAVMGLPPDFPDEKHIAAALQYNSVGRAEKEDPPSLLPGYVYYFDIAPGYELPEIKLNIPLRNYGRDDLSLARDITGWMDARGRGAYCPRYMDMLTRLSDDGGLEETQGLQSFISCLFRNNGELDITTYLAAKGVPPGPAARRATRKREY